MSVTKTYIASDKRANAPYRNATRQLKIITAIAGFGLALAPLAAVADSMSSRAVEAGVQGEKIAPKLLGGSEPTPSMTISLGKPTSSEKAAFNATRSQNKYEQVGMGRALNKSQSKIDLGSLQWNTASSGTRYTTLEYVTSEARAARLGLNSTSIPKGVSVYVYGTTNNSIYGPFTAADLRAVALTPGTIYWLPTIEGDTVRLELQASSSLSFTSLSFGAPMLSHLTKSALGNPLKNLSDIGDSGSCNIDIACPPSNATWVTRGNSVAKYYLTDSSGNTGICTGTLLNSPGASPPAYFITANHCVNEVAEATSMHLYWFFQRATCGGPNPTAPLTETFGATFINAVVANDATLVRLNSAPPTGAIYSGWNAASVTAGDTLVALHHPAGDLKKYSSGTNQGFAGYLSNTTNASASHIRMIWTQGTTEGGSSGSGLFNAAGELVGTLHGGNASCGVNIAQPDWYGRFDHAYPTLQPWLTPGAGGPPPPQPPPAPPSIELTSGTPVSGSVEIGEHIWYRIQTLSNTSSVTVTLTGLNADADIYIYKDTQSGTEACKSILEITANESCTVAVTGVSTIYVAVYGFQAANYTVTATLNNAVGLGGGDSGGGGGTFGTLLLALLLLVALMRVWSVRRLGAKN